MVRSNENITHNERCTNYMEIKMTDKNWTGNKKSVYSTLGASNHTKEEREVNDYYATDPRTIKPLFENESFSGVIWECACGEGHLSDEIGKFHGQVYATDLIDRGYSTHGSIDFLKVNSKWDGDIITNPPYKYAQQFIEKALEIIRNGNKVAMFLKIQFLEGQKRYELFRKYPPKVVYVFSKRQSCAKNGDFKNMKGGAVAFAWFVWVKGFKGDTIIKWIK